MQKDEGFLQLKAKLQAKFSPQETEEILKILLRKIEIPLFDSSAIEFVRSCLIELFKEKNFINSDVTSLYFGKVITLLLKLKENEIFTEKETSLLIFTATICFKRETLGGN